MQTDFVFLTETDQTNFVFLTDIDQTIIENARYFTMENFLGRKVAGYKTNRIICTKQAALALNAVNEEFKTIGYTLVIYDGYRPEHAVGDFIQWSTNHNDDIKKHLYYPTINKKDLFDLGYIGTKSSHSRGSTIDLTIIENSKNLHKVQLSQKTLNNGEIIPFLDDGTVDMGSSFDLFHEVSHHQSDLVTEQQYYMRNLLKQVMKNHGFVDYDKEWWHYTLEDEPYPDTYFNF